MSRTLPIVCLVMLSAVLACGTTTSPSDTTSPSAVDAGPPAVDGGTLNIDRATKRDLTDLTLDERKELCDWTANIGGGYGKVTLCEGGLSVSNMKDQATCLASFLSACFTVIVSDWEACRRKEVTDPCAMLLFSAPECRKVQLCIGRTDGGPPREPRDGG